jgi:hypothetical protein
MHKCKICGKEFEKRFSLEKHITILYGKEKIRKHCPLLVYKNKYENDYRFSKKNLKKMYLYDMKSTPMISSELGINKKTLLDTMDYYHIKKRNISEASRNQFKRDGIWNKGLTKFNNKSIMKYAKERLGKNNPFYTAPGFEERKRKFYESGSKGRMQFLANRNPASTEQRICKILDAFKFSYLRNFSLRFYENGKTKWRLFDFLIENMLLLETNGNYFHANPKMYKSNDVITISKRKLLAKDIWEYDSAKIDLGKNSGYSVLVLWENDMNNMMDVEILDIIKRELKI